MTYIQRLSLAFITGWMGFQAYTFELDPPILPVLYLAMVYITLRAPHHDDAAPSLGASLVWGGTTHAFTACWAWSLHGYVPGAHGALIGAAAVLGAVLGVLTACARPVGDEADVQVGGFALSWVLVHAGFGSLSSGIPLLVSSSLVVHPIWSQALALGGPPLLEGLLACVGGYVGEAALRLARDRQLTPSKAPLVRALGLTIVVGFLGHLRLSAFATSVQPTEAHAPQDAQPVVVVQGAIPGWFQQQTVTWDRLHGLSQELYRALVAAEASWLEKQRAPWLVLPESAIYRVLPDGQETWGFVDDLLPQRLADTTVFTAVSTVNGSSDDAPYTYRFLMGERADDGTLAPRGESGKAVLTPLGDHNYAVGVPSQNLQTHAAEVAPLVCWDALFADLSRARVLEGAEVLMAVANDGGALREGPGVHARMAVMRAIETGRPLIFASQTGPSLVADPLGRIVGMMPQGAQGSLRTWIDPAPVWTPWLLWGPYLLPLCSLLWIGAAWRARTTRVALSTDKVR